MHMHTGSSSIHSCLGTAKKRVMRQSGAMRGSIMSNTKLGIPTRRMNLPRMRTTVPPNFGFPFPKDTLTKNR